LKLKPLVVGSKTFVKAPNQAKVDYWLRREVIPFCVVPGNGERRQKLFERVKIVRIGV